MQRPAIQTMPGPAQDQARLLVELARAVETIRDGGHIHEVTSTAPILAALDDGELRIDSTAGRLYLRADGKLYFVILTEV